MATGNDNESPRRAMSTAEVLVSEFKLLHGEAAWTDLTTTPAATKFAEDAAASARDENGILNSWLPPGGMIPKEELRNLALHAFAVRSLTAERGNEPVNQEKLDEVEKDPGQTALCLSGGGIRSAAFALGVLQGLSRWDLLDKFHYLSTVSGGGYIGAWLTAWRHRKGLKAVKTGLQLRTGEQVGTGEPLPLQRLRFNENFITPRVGLMSADTWAVLATIIRNLVLNWLVWAPLLCGLLLLPRVMQGIVVVAKQPHASAMHFCGVALVLAFFGFLMSASNRPDTGRNNMTQRQFVFLFLLPVAAAAVSLTIAVASWLGDPFRAPPAFMRFGVGGLSLYAAVRATALIYSLIFSKQAASRNPAVQPCDWKTIAGIELGGWAFAGACAGLSIAAGIWCCYRFQASAPQELAAWLAVAGPPWILSSVLLGEIAYVGATSRSPRGDRDREWLARVSGWMSAVAVAYLVFAWLVLFGWSTFQTYAIWFKSILVASGLGTIIGGLTPLTKATAGMKQKLPLNAVVNLLAGIFILVGSAALADVTLAALQVIGPHVAQYFQGAPTPFIAFPPLMALLFLVSTVALLLAFSALASVFVNINLFSLHAMYRNRLTKTFLGASNIGDAEERNKFDGFSLGDNLVMSDLAPKPESHPKLFHVINISLNILASKNLAWQERRAEPFVCTPLHTGGNRVGYRASKDYGKGITLGTAMTISGAAVSPNWGYHSSPLTSFLMMLFNVRLGWWFGNPKGHSKWRFLETWDVRGPRLSWKIFLQEAFGRTSEDEPWIYVSDGGHFENLGVYEMIRRRCRTVVVSDAGADANCTLEDLGNMARKVAIDLGVHMRFRHIYVQKRNDPPKPGVYCAVGTIYYPEGRCGTLIYLKPGLYGSEPVDVRAYAADNKKFPHDSTMNQWFGEAQFESYRSLGCHIISEICRDRTRNAPACVVKGNISMNAFLKQAESYVDEYSKSYDTNGATVIDIRRWPTRDAPELPRTTMVAAQAFPGAGAAHAPSQEALRKPAVKSRVGNRKPLPESQQ